ncbi:unnamed protein product [Cuscuta epithymum]|uniref:Uncharacterized protein n=1 Tax=Cuscuta epithymum TaxID=186058 RepID=A0AAV0EVK1_9ASTE|nr:unnamed protein product [Cuscuta epithymum]
MGYQNVIVMRHGHRLDTVDKRWTSDNKNNRPWDPPICVTEEPNLFSDAAESIQDGVGAPIDRVIVSPFLRCLQTASKTVEALLKLYNDPDVEIKVCIEFGLAEVMNDKVIKTPPRDEDFGFDISECEVDFPSQTVYLDPETYEQVYQQLPGWGEAREAAYGRYRNVVRALADKYPSENLLIVTHALGVESLTSQHKETPAGKVAWVEVGGYAHLRRSRGKNNDDFELPNLFRVDFRHKPQATRRELHSVPHFEAQNETSSRGCCFQVCVSILSKFGLVVSILAWIALAGSILYWSGVLDKYLVWARHFGSNLIS